MSGIIVPPLPASPVVSTIGSNGTDVINGTQESTVVNGSNGKHGIADKSPVNPPLTYIDPAADTSLVSNEGRVFKVESYVLKAAR